MSRPVLFWDSSALIAAVMAEARSPYRDLLRLGEAGAVDMRLSRDVAREVDRVFRRWGDDLVDRFARIADRAGFALTLDPTDETVAWCVDMTGYAPDARILAAAHECGADVLLTHDRKHLLGNPLIGPPDTCCLVLSPRDCLELVVQRLVAEDADGA